MGKNIIFYVLNNIIPKGSSRRRFVKRLLKPFGLQSSDPYSVWQYERKNKIELIESKALKVQPLISIVIPAFNTPEKYLISAIRSVEAQFYDNWELVIINASDDLEAKERINQCKAYDKRIKVFETDNKGISANTNYGIMKSSGGYIGFMDHDDLLDSIALQEVVKILNKNPRVGLIYSDEDKLTEDGSSYIEPHFKPDWSPQLITYVNYITHFTVIKKELIDKVGGLDANKDGAQDYDLILKVTDIISGKEIVHIPKVLYHWRAAQASTAQDIANKPYIRNSGVKALDDHYNRKKIAAKVTALESLPGFYSVVYENTDPITLVLLPFAEPGLMKRYIKLLQSLSLMECEKIITPVACGVKNEITLKEPDREIFLRKALKKATVHCLIINDFIIPRDQNWIRNLSGLLNETSLRAASPLIISRTAGANKIEDSGIVASSEGNTMLFKGYTLGDSTPFGNTMWPRNVDFLTGKVTALRTDELQQHLDVNILNSLDSFLHEKPDNSYYSVWSNVVAEHIKVPQLDAGKHSLFNPNLRMNQGDIGLYCNEQQIIDAIRKEEEIYGVNNDQ